MPVPNPSNFVDVLSSPGVWTGKGGVTAVTDLLSNSALQDKIQFGLMKSSYDTLVASGEISIPRSATALPTAQIFDGATGSLSSVKSLSSGFSSALSSAGVDLSTGRVGSIEAAAATGGISGGIAALGGVANSISGSLGGSIGSIGSALGGLPDLGGLLANASKFGVGNAVDWAKGALPSVDIGSIKNQMDSLAKQGQFAVNFSDFKLPAAVAGVIPAAGFEGTVDRSTVNAAFTKLVGSDKIPTPTFSPQAVSTASLENAAKQAKSLLSTSIPGGLTGLSSLGSNVPGGLGNLSALSSRLDSSVNSLGDPNAPPYTGDDPIIRARLGLPPIEEA